MAMKIMMLICVALIIIIVVVALPLIKSKKENDNSSVNKESNSISNTTEIKKEEKIIIEDEKYSYLNDIDGIKLYAGLTDDEISELSKRSIDKLDVDIPEEYKVFLKVTNGLSNGDSKFYSKFEEKVRGRYDIVNKNYDYRELTDIEDFIILGNDSITYFVYNLKNNKYQALSDGTLDVLYEYNTFNELLKAVVTGEIYK